ncbi:extensin-like [Ananas comosus]|uniref:Extensin-like n=1 Tax=Ananas comosus TaxID=4615 RepID=A0A6P5G4A4_ANACO|nr:extensin-like [Ananas comosus]
MDSTTSGSMQSSSGGGGGGGGGGDEEFSSHPHEYISSFLTFPPPPPPPPPQQPPNSTPFDPFSTFLNPFPPSSNPSNLTPPARTDVADFTASFRPQPQPPTTSLPSNTVPVQPPAPRGGSRKRSRASRKPPTTVLTTDTSNFRAMVQEFTGFPTPPFASSSPFVRPRLGLLHPTATVAGPPPPYLLRPSPQKAQTVIDAIASIARNSNIGSSSLSSEQQRRQQQQQQQEQQQQRAQTAELIAGDGLANWIDYDGLDQIQTQTQTQSLFGTDVGDYGDSQGVDYISRLSSSTTEIGSFHAADKGVGLLSHVDVNGRR